ncbi:CGNR zinc finger domain-containing protein [Mycoplasma anserisalpingitidis]|uniref:CGNR zinc finger domain-containing protein n=1 Tax=Mycoplasma anserisalpingitidis TaxID=519450 RepID=A0A5B8JYF1_9MOLU|nr:CGNR zinc finger domain-containing protein [Mycoplasma anserisalpingitidis]
MRILWKTFLVKATSYNRKYCSDACGNNANAARSRARKKGVNDYSLTPLFSLYPSSIILANCSWYLSWLFEL